MKKLIIYFLILLPIIITSCSLFFPETTIIRGRYWMSKYNNETSNELTGLFYNSNTTTVFLTISESGAYFRTRIIDSIISLTNSETITNIDSGITNISIELVPIIVTNITSNQFYNTYVMDEASDTITFTEYFSETNWDITPNTYEYSLSMNILELKKEIVTNVSNTNVIELAFVRMN